MTICNSKIMIRNLNLSIFHRCQICLSQFFSRHKLKPEILLRQCRNKKAVLKQTRACSRSWFRSSLPKAGWLMILSRLRTVCLRCSISLGSFWVTMYVFTFVSSSILCSSASGVAPRLACRISFSWKGEL